VQGLTCGWPRAVWLFYFAGMGSRWTGRIPPALNARDRRQQDVRYQALPMGQVVGAMEDAVMG